jgi:hypothetical protein
MIWNEEYINSLGGLPKHVQEEIKEMMTDANYSPATKTQKRSNLFSDISTAWKNFQEKANRLFRRNETLNM